MNMQCCNWRILYKRVNVCPKYRLIHAFCKKGKAKKQHKIKNKEKINAAVCSHK